MDGKLLVNVGGRNNASIVAVDLVSGENALAIAQRPRELLVAYAKDVWQQRFGRVHYANESCRSRAEVRLSCCSSYRLENADQR